MPRLAYCITSALLLTAIVSPHADAARYHYRDNTAAHYRGDTAAFGGARAQAAPTERPPAAMDMRQQCYEKAAKQVSSSNQDLQTVRDYVYKNCAFDHGMQP
jgi:hypothetical protein